MSFSPNVEEALNLRQRKAFCDMPTMVRLIGADVRDLGVDMWMVLSPFAVE